MKTLEQILISRGELEKIYRGHTGLHIWRGLSKDDQRGNPLYPDIDPRTLPSGDIRDPDVEKELIDGVWIVKAKVGMGTSTVDKEGIFGHKKWQYNVIPKGVVIPSQLIITKDFYMSRKKCWHYSISPNYDMPLDDYFKALDQLAINAGIKIRSLRNARNRKW